MSFELLVLLMPVPVPLGLEVEFSRKGLLQVDPRLVGQTEDHEDHIGQFLAQILDLIGWFFALFPVPSGDDPGHLSYFLRELGHIGQFVKVSHPVGLNPIIYRLLGFA